MKISIIEDYRIRDAGTERSVSSIIEKININEPEVILDFIDCGVDYPATSLILDKVLFALKEFPDNKTLSILFDFNINELVLHKWFFVGSKFFKIPEDNKSMTIQEFKQLLSNELRSNSIIMEIKIMDMGEIKKTISYESN